MPKQLIVIGAATPTIIRVIDDLNKLGDGISKSSDFLTMRLPGWEPTSKASRFSAG